MATEALILVEPAESALRLRLEALLGFFGVQNRAVGPEEILAGGAGGVFASSAAFEALARRPDGWGKPRSVFVVDAAPELAARLMGCAVANAAPVDEWRIADDRDDDRDDLVDGHDDDRDDALRSFCGPLAGLHVAARPGDRALAVETLPAAARPLIHAPEGAALLHLPVGSWDVFLSTGGVIDLAAPPTGRNFDIRDHSLDAIPMALFIRWAFADAAWRPAQTAACLVIDDPLLHPRYGLLQFQRLADLTRRIGFSANIAFIPWNWRRSARKVVALFRDNPGRLSLSVHGCDHTGGEFGSKNKARLALKARRALARMARHQARTRLPFDPVMVFPQGVFSRAAMQILKRSGFIGAVNTEVAGVDPPPRPLTIADWWNVAVMNYDDFPIFTRRYPAQGLENFAFDALLGKPVILVAHHNDCADGCRHIAGFIARLNALNMRLDWTDLTGVVERSIRLRKISDGLEVRIFGAAARIANPTDRKIRLNIRKSEAAPESVAAIEINGLMVDWRAQDAEIVFETALDAGETCFVRTLYRPAETEILPTEGLVYEAKTLMRRLLSELRDNYVTPLRRALSP